MSAMRVTCRSGAFLFESNPLILRPSRRSHSTHAPQIQCQAHEFELGLHSVQSAQAELAKSQHALDPTVWWLRDPFALPVVRLASISLQLGGHRGRVRTLCQSEHCCLRLACRPAPGSPRRDGSQKNSASRQEPALPTHYKSRGSPARAAPRPIIDHDFAAAYRRSLAPNNAGLPSLPSHQRKASLLTQ